MRMALLEVVFRDEICQKFYTTRFLSQKFYTLFSFTIKRRKCTNFCVKSYLLSVNLAILDKFGSKRRCFLEKFTQLAQILHDRWSRRSRQISTLI